MPTDSGQNLTELVSKLSAHKFVTALLIKLSCELY